MPQQDAMHLKEQILSILRRRGPSLPVHVSQETGMTILFSSAFLAELLSEKKIKITDMKVGGSPVYYLPGHEYLLERFSQHLKSKEKDAYSLLKEKSFLFDEEQEPAIRIALRSIKDFAFPFKHKEKMYWRYFRIPESDFKPKEKEEPIKEKQKQEEPKKIEVQIPQPTVEEKKPEQIEPAKEKTSEKEQEKIEKKEPKKPKALKKTVKRKPTPPKENKFFLKIKEFLVEKDIEIVDIVDINKTSLILKIKDKKEEKLVIAYSKKRINEADIISAHKKAIIFNMPYIILTAGDSAKKIKELIEAIKGLEYLDKIG